MDCLIGGLIYALDCSYDTVTNMYLCDWGILRNFKIKGVLGSHWSFYENDRTVKFGLKI